MAEAPVTMVVLAAGRSSRMGRPKAALALDGLTLLERIVHTASPWPTIVVASETLAVPTGCALIRNARPQDGMNYSLALADAAVDPTHALVVLLADMPDVPRSAIARVIAQYDPRAYDVVATQVADRLLPPVLFAPAARARIATLGAGDGLHRLRDDPALRRAISFATEPPAAFDDLDTPEQYARRRGAGADRPL